jgi:hypothetical protein
MSESGNEIERITGLHGEMTKYLRDEMRDYFDSDLKNAHYLLVAHGAGLAGCLATLKDYATTPQLKGVGIFIVIFCFGLLLATMGTASLSLRRSNVLKWLTHGGEKPSINGYSTVLPVAGSLLCLIGALFLIAYRFYKL